MKRKNNYVKNLINLVFVNVKTGKGKLKEENAKTSAITFRIQNCLRITQNISWESMENGSHWLMILQYIGGKSIHVNREEKKEIENILI